MGTRRVLVIANETAAEPGLLDALARRGATDALDVLVVCPALNSRLRHWLSDEDGARAAAEERLASSLAALGDLGVAAAGRVGDADPLRAMEDALRTYPADEIVVSTHAPGRSNWLERDVVRRARARFPLPVAHVVAETVPHAAPLVPAVT
jgi:hypothetical protein